MKVNVSTAKQPEPVGNRNLYFSTIVKKAEVAASAMITIPWRRAGGGGGENSADDRASGSREGKGKGAPLGIYYQEQRYGGR